MAVYTTLENKDMQEIFSHYDLGELVTYQGILAGITNTNYRVETTKAQVILTIVENFSVSELSFFMDFIYFLTSRGLKASQPFRGKKDEFVHVFQGKPVVVSEFLKGKTLVTSSVLHVQKVGRELARMHCLSENFPQTRKNTRGFEWFEEISQRVVPFLEPTQQKLVSSEIQWLRIFQEQKKEMASGIIHADLFQDNVLFDGDELEGFIDFYFSCQGPFVYDMAITVNAWCSDSEGHLEKEKVEAFLESYSLERKLSMAEVFVWPNMLRTAAVRFWLSRLRDSLFPKQGKLTHTHDPMVYQNILQDRVQYNDEYGLWLKQIVERGETSR